MVYCSAQRQPRAAAPQRQPRAAARRARLPQPSTITTSTAPPVCPKGCPTMPWTRQPHYNEYYCSRCDALSVGPRWHCAKHEEDYCNRCRPGIPEHEPGGPGLRPNRCDPGIPQHEPDVIQASSDEKLEANEGRTREFMSNIQGVGAEPAPYSPKVNSEDEPCGVCSGVCVVVCSVV